MLLLGLITKLLVPGDKNQTSGISWSPRNACCMIGHNSSPGIIAAIEGVPVFLTDAGRSQAMDVAHHSFNSLLEPQQFDREPWLQKLAMCHWTLEESKQGLIWTHMRKWADKNNIPAPI